MAELRISGSGIDVTVVHLSEPFTEREEVKTFGATFVVPGRTHVGSFIVDVAMDKPVAHLERIDSGVHAELRDDDGRRWHVVVLGVNDKPVPENLIRLSGITLSRADS